MTKILNYCEHEVIEIGNGANQLCLSQVSKIDKILSSQNKKAFSWVGRNKIKLNQMVGMVCADDLQLEILPKIKNLHDFKARKILVQMICEALEIDIFENEIAAHDYNNHTLLEVLINIFANRLISQVRRGLARNYVRHNEDLPKMRGKMNVYRQFSKFAATPQIISCEFDEFSAKNALNQLLLCAVVNLRKISRLNDNQRLLREIEAHFEDVDLITPQMALLQKIELSRNHANWRILKQLATFLLKSMFQTLHSGQIEGVSLLFDMNELFEAYIGAIAMRTFTPLGWEVKLQHPHKCLAQENGNRRFKMKPDIHLKSSARTIIIDTKWKHLWQINEQKISQQDAYQMFAYGANYNAEFVFLLYPHSEELGETCGIHKKMMFNKIDSNLVIASIDITKAKSLSAKLLKLLSLESTQSQIA